MNSRRKDAPMHLVKWLNNLLCPLTASELAFAPGTRMRRHDGDVRSSQTIRRRWAGR